MPLLRLSLTLPVMVLIAHGANAACYKDEYVPESIECAEAVNDGFADFQGTGCQVTPAHFVPVEIPCDVIIDIKANRSGFTIKDLFDSQHPGEWQDAEKNKIMNIHPGVIVGGTSNDAVLVGGAWKGTLTLNVMGQIQGKGGAANGGAGGNAINANSLGDGNTRMRINLASTGAIRAGGGGGGYAGTGGTGGGGYVRVDEQAGWDRGHNEWWMRWKNPNLFKIWWQGQVILDTSLVTIPDTYAHGGWIYYRYAPNSDGTRHAVGRYYDTPSSGGVGGVGGSGGVGQGYGQARTNGVAGVAGGAGIGGAGAGGKGGTGGNGGSWGAAGAGGADGDTGGYGNRSGYGPAGTAGSPGGPAGAAILNSHNVSLSITPGGIINGAY